MTWLQSLNLETNCLENIDFLSNHVNLNYLDLSNNAGINIQIVQYFVNLQFLNLELCYISEISALRPLAKLKVLNLSDNNIIFIHPLRQLTQLTQLNMNYNKIINHQTIQEFFDKQNLLGKQFTWEEQYDPSIEQFLFAAMMHQIDSITISLRQTGVNRQKIKKSLQFYKKHVSQTLQRQKDELLLFSHNIVSLFAQLNCEVYQ
ncbi:leucine-rich_repeat domain-containing protein [Hexamita inflata]|uniref:Leucine-rich repeat domain-containing protein n=1 Tax=Hexamita inflata TaxID=28002 RepID=A0AA86NRT5_9EUKA|nr:leucine-rich repeat domain-containing protein [Hexamita inflata]